MFSVLRHVSCDARNRLGQQERDSAHPSFKTVISALLGCSRIVDANSIICSTVSSATVSPPTAFRICDVALAFVPLVEIDLRGAMLGKFVSCLVTFSMATAFRICDSAMASVPLFNINVRGAILGENVSCLVTDSQATAFRICEVAFASVPWVAYNLLGAIHAENVSCVD